MDNQSRIKPIILPNLLNGNESEKKVFFQVLRYFIIAFLIIVVPTFLYFSTPPRDFPIGEIVKIKSGITLGQAAELLEEEAVIRSAKFMQILALTRDRKFTVVSGSYLFNDPVSVFNVLSRINRGIYGDVYERITIPEGSSNAQIVDILKNSELNTFGGDKFLSLTEGKEGYLFPDTYFFLPDIIEEEIIEQMESNFEEQIKGLQIEINLSEHPLEEIITMASIVEKEANTNNGGEDEAAIIAGILWKRIKIGMPLQVDAPFLYILGKGSAELTQSDLQINSPFNTYKYTGLVPSPIGNPGKNAIIASLRPGNTDYLFYLHDKDGLVHYAKTFQEHSANVFKYLK